MAGEFKKPEFLLPAKPKKSLEQITTTPEESISSILLTSTADEGSKELALSSPASESVVLNEKLSRDPPKSREQLLQEKQAKYAEIISSLKYNPPDVVGASCADSRYSFEVLKNGTIVDRFKFSKLDNKGFYVIGRVPACDVVAENPTVSRTHAILQFISCPVGKKGGSGSTGKVGNGEAGIPDKTGMYLFDLNSTHGTFINKNQIFPSRYYRLHVGHVLKFGNSTRLYVLLGPSDDEEEESDKSVTELQNERLQRDLERKKLDEQGLLIKGLAGEDGAGDDGCAWGMSEDAEEESESRENPFAINFEQSESFDNPKKTLRGWFEREGYDLVYDCREKAPGQFICRINLPVDGPAGQPVFAEVDHKGKKKEAVHQAALQACQILDKYGVLRVSHTESKNKRRKERDYADQDYYSSDEDTFLDRTGSVEHKREKRMKIAGKVEDSVETFESLSAKANAFQSEIDTLQSQITKAQDVNADDDVDVDDYVKFLKTGATDVKKLKSRLRQANEELKKINKLLNIAKPASLPVNLLDKKSGVIDANLIPKSTNSIISTIGNKMQIKLNSTKSSLLGPRVSSKLKSDESFEMKPVEDDSDSICNANSASPRNPKTMEVPSGPRLPTQHVDDIKRETKSTLKPFTEEAEENPNKPTDQNSESSENDDLEDTSALPNQTSTKKKRRIRQKVKKEIKYDYDESDPKYSTWVAPSNQTGDGKTALNEKLGY